MSMYCMCHNDHVEAREETGLYESALALFRGASGTHEPLSVAGDFIHSANMYMWPVVRKLEEIEVTVSTDSQNRMVPTGKAANKLFSLTTPLVPLSLQLEHRRYISTVNEERRLQT